MSVPSELKSIFDRQQAFKKVAALSTCEERKAHLEALKASVLKHSDAIARALYADLGKPITEEPVMEVGKVVHDIDHALENLEEWMKPQSVEVSSSESETAKAFIQFEARGSVLILSAWNFPFSLALSPLVPALAAGNTAIIKTNELAPAVAEAVKVVVEDAFDPTLVAVNTGDVSEAIALQQLPFDHIFFTGSPSVGKQVMRSAAENLASVTLELGGKCPAIVDKNASLESACANIAIGRTFNLGQVCLCADYAIVHEDILQAFVSGVGAVLKATYYDGDTYCGNRNSRIIDMRNFLRLKGYLDDAINKGAKVVFGGHCDETSLIIEPTILVDVPEDTIIMQQEIFGPILPIVTYRNQEDIIGLVDKRAKPLGLYIFSDDDPFVEYVLNNTSSGGVSVNGWASHYFELNLPFGGVNHSGMGSYHGRFGFEELSHRRSVFVA